MKWKMRKVLSLVVAVMMVCMSMPFAVYGAQTNSEFSSTISKEMETNGDEVSISQIVSANAQAVIDTSSGKTVAVENLPSSYSSSSDLPEYTPENNMSFEVQRDIVTPVKDAMYSWSFVVMSVAETSYILNTGVASNSVDFNEYHHIWYAFHEAKDELNLFDGDYMELDEGWFPMESGSAEAYPVSLCVLANWMGASNASESVFNADDVWAESTPPDSFAYDDIAHLENAYILSMPNIARYDSMDEMSADVNVIKQAILDYGSIATGHYQDYNGLWTANGYQCVDRKDFLEQYGSGNFAVQIVGWNDNVPVSAFTARTENGPEGNGAWLVKGTSGIANGFGGYYWVSYYDRSFYEEAYVFDMNIADNYDNSYQYDGSSAFNTGCYILEEGEVPWNPNAKKCDSVYAANAFVADSDEIVEAVGLFALHTDLEYTIAIYTDLQPDAPPASGKVATLQRGTMVNVGFHTIELDEPVWVNEGERYAIVVNFYKEGEDILLAATQTPGVDLGYLVAYDFAKEGQSYIGRTKDEMMDLNAWYEEVPGVWQETDIVMANVRIKSFTNEQPGPYDDVPYGVAQAADGNWYYYKDGVIDYSYSGLARNEEAIWFICNGKVDFSVNGLAECGDSWYYFANGALQRVNTLALYNDGWFYIEDGQIAWDYTGLVEYYGTWYYVNGGALDWGYTGLTEYYGAWYYVNGGVLDWGYTGLTEYYGAWYYVNGGVLDWGYTGLTEYYGAWYYVNGGVLDWGYTGLTYYLGTWYYVEGGVLNWNYTGTVYYDGRWYYVENGVMKHVV